ncbi:MAG: helix-turn-helix domain-containing protein [Bacteroidota bacterium]
MPAHPVFDESTILDKARDLFWERGYNATSIADLEKGLGISRSSIYNTFGGKRALYDLTLNRYSDGSLQNLQTALGASTDLKQSLKDLMSQAIQSQTSSCVNGSKGCYVVNATTEMASRCPDALSFVSNNREEFIRIMISIFEGSNQLDLSQNSAQDLANLLFVLYNGSQVVVKTGIDREQLQQSIFTAIDSMPWLENQLG